MIKKIVAYLPSTVIPILVNFVLVFIYAGRMSPADYGVYNVYLNSISIIYSVSLSFLQSASFRFYSMNDVYSDKEQFYSTYYFANILISCIVAVFLLVANLFLRFDWAVITFSVATNALYQFDVNMYRLRDSTVGYTFSRLSASFGALAFICICVVFLREISFTIPIYTFYSAYLFTIIVEFLRCSKYLSIRKVSKSLLVESVRFGIPMMGVTVMGLLISYSAQYAIMFFLSEEAVGFYSLGFRLSDTVISNITMIILTVMTPAVMRVYDESHYDKAASGTKMLTRLINLDLWVVVPICVMIACYSGDLIGILFPSYEGAQSIVQIIVLSAVLRSLSMFTCKGLELARETGKMFRFLLISLIANVAYVLLFVPVYGIEAAGHASIIAYAVYNFLLIRESKAYVPIHIDLTYLLNILIISVTIAVISIAFKMFFGLNNFISLITQGSICVALYLILSMVLGLHKQFIGLSE